MLRYVLRRFLLLIPMVLAASVIIFLMLRLGTGDPALDYLRLSNLPPTPEMLASTRTMLGLDQPLYVQYGTWLWKALHLDFGISFASQRPVLDDMLNFLPATLELAGAALDIGHMMLHVAGMSFLGLGVTAPTAEWGVMINDARQYIWTQPLQMFWPGLALFISVMAFNLVGDALRDHLDPHLVTEHAH